MRFAVNAHLLSPVGGYRQAGVSHYIDQVVRRLPTAAPHDEWTIYIAPGVAPLSQPAANIRFRQARLSTTNPLIRIVWEQVVAPVVTARDRSSAIFCPLNVVPLMARCPAVVTIHDLAFLRFPERFPVAKQRYLAALTRLSARRAAHILTVSEATRREVIELLAIPPAKVTATPNGRDEELAPLPAETVARFRVERELPERFLLFLGTLEPRKNLTTLLRAYSQTRTSLGVPLIVAGGKGWLYEPIFKLVDELQLHEHVRFVDYVPREELGLWYNAATALVYPSLYEGFGLPPLEAMQCGTPVVTSNVSSMPEVVGDAAITFNPTDVEALASALLEVITNAELRDELRRRGLAQATKFSWDRTAQGTVEALYAVAQGTT